MPEKTDSPAPDPAAGSDTGRAPGGTGHRSAGGDDGAPDTMAGLAIGRAPGGTGGRPPGREQRIFERPSQRPAAVRPIGAPGHMGVDYEERVDFGRLRSYRLARAQQALRASDCGAFLLFDFYNIRYTTQTWIGGALGDKMIRYALLLRDRPPVEWDFGSAVRHHKLYSQWLPDENWRPGFLGFRGAVAPEAGLMRDAVTEIKSLLAEAGVADVPLGIDIVEPPFLFELQRQGIMVADAQDRKSTRLNSSHSIASRMPSSA